MINGRKANEIGNVQIFSLAASGNNIFVGTSSGVYLSTRFHKWQGNLFLNK